MGTSTGVVSETCGSRDESLAPSHQSPVHRRWRADAAASAGFLLAAAYVTASPWTGDPDRAVAGSGSQDQVLMEWFLTHVARSLVHLLQHIGGAWIWRV
jgi:hypothetical protein